MKKILLPAIFAVLLIVAPSASALAKNNNGATLSISPAQPIVGDSVIFSGCNYQPDFGFTLTVQSDDRSGPYVGGGAVYSDSAGCLVSDPFVPPNAGDYYAVVSFGNGHKVATLKFTVT